MSIHSIVFFVFCAVLLTISSPSQAFESSDYSPGYPDIRISITPNTPSVSTPTSMIFEYGNLAVGVSDIFSSSVQIQGQTIRVAWNYQTYIPSDGFVTLPSFYFPRGSIDLGLLDPGNYTLEAMLPFADFTGNATKVVQFTVVPEVNALSIAALILGSLLISSRFRSAQREGP